MQHVTMEHGLIGNANDLKLLFSCILSGSMVKRRAFVFHPIAAGNWPSGEYISNNI